MANQAEQKYGSVMLILFWIVLLALLVWGFTDYLQRQTKPTISDGQGFREVELTRSQGSHYIAQGSINGHPVNFIVDTGATLVALPASMKEQLSLTISGKGQARTAGGLIPIGYTRLDSVRIGNIELRNVSASIDLSHTNSIDEVLLGMSFLRELELTQQDGKLRIRQYLP